MHKESNLSAKQRLFLDALISEEAMGDLRTAMRLAGYSDNTKVAHTAKELRGEIQEATETLLAMYAPKAAYALTSVLDNPYTCLLYTSPSPRDVEESRMPSSA